MANRCDENTLPRSLAELFAQFRHPWLADDGGWRSGKDILDQAARYQVPAQRGALVLVPVTTAYQALAGAVAVESAGGVAVLWPSRVGLPPYAATLPRVDHGQHAISGRTSQRWSSDAPVVGVVSGGTSGAGKVVLLDVARAVRNAAAVASRVSTGQARRVASLRNPAFSAGLVCDLLGSLLAGDQVAAIPVWSVLLGLRAVLRHRPDAVHATPTLVSEVLDLLPPIRRFVLSGEPLSAAVLSRIRESHPAALILNGYGLSEAGPRISVGPAQARQDSVGCGLPLPGVTVRHRDQDGMLIVTTPYACEAVLDSRGITRPGPAILTGDAGRVDPDGTVVLLGRTDELATVGGCPVNLAVLTADLRQAVPGVGAYVDTAAGEIVIAIPAASDLQEAESRRRLAVLIRAHWPMLSRVRWRRSAVTGPACFAVTEAGKSRPDRPAQSWSDES